jgi:hypothetical protein
MMSSITAFLGVIALLMIAAGIYFVAPISLSVGAVFEMSGAVLAVAFVGLTDGL